MSLAKIINHINVNSGFYSFASTLLMVGVTLRYVSLTKQMLNENKKAREQQSRPFILVDFEVKNYIIYLKIKNAGNSPAKNIDININKKIENVPKNLEYLPPNKEIFYRLNLVVEDDPDLNDTDIWKINVNYKSIDNKHFSNSYSINMITYIDMAIHKKGGLANIEKHLNNISKSLGKSNSNSVKSHLKDISKSIK